MFRRDMAVGVVFDDVEVMLVGQLQHPVRAGRRKAVPGWVVEHADADQQLGPVQLAVPRHHFEVWTVRVPRHRQDAHAHGRQPR